MSYYIYKSTDKTNGKAYVGCTRNIGHRIGQHIKASMNDNPIFHQAILEHGVCSFVWEIIDTAEYADEAFDKEKRYIDEYNSFYPNGYNATTGGAGSPGYTGRRVVQLTFDGELVKTYESANSTERDGFHPTNVLKTCQGISNSSKGYIFMFEDDYNKNGARPYRKRQPTNARAVVQCDLQGNKIAEYRSLQLASESTGSSRTAISGCLAGRYKTANGFIWVYKEDFPIKDISKYSATKRGIKIAQLDIETEKTIAIFDSVSEAGRSLGVSYKNIQKVLDLPNRTAYGFKWKKVSQ